MSALICGSYAFDNIMVFQDRFKNHILPEQVHILSVAFLVPELRREFGGTAGNIAYNLKLLGADPIPMATVGTDFGPYWEWLERWGINTKHIREISEAYTAQAFITTDLDDNQITAFHPGAMNYAHENKVSEADGVSLGIIAPDGRDGMLEHAKQFADSGIPFIFDPGQGLPMFDGTELTRFIEQATWVAVNDYESQMIQERTGLSLKAIGERVDALIVTRGGEGSMVYSKDGELHIPAAKVDQLNDPTGCGDAYRAGLIYGLMNDMDWETTGRIASLMGAIKIQQHGTQNHSFEPQQFWDWFREEFGYAAA